MLNWWEEGVGEQVTCLWRVEILDDVIRTTLLITGCRGTFQLICCTKMEGGQQGVVLKLFLLTLVPQLSSFEVVNQKNVDNYVIERRGGDKDDLFMLTYQNGSYCLQNADQVSEWCMDLKASFEKTVTTKGKSCGCSCSGEFPTFLPPKRICINKTQAQKLGGKYVNHNLIYFKSYTVNLKSGRNVK